MIAYYWRRFLRKIGYRRVFMRPFDRGLAMSNFWCWRYAPELEPRDYDETEYFKLGGE